MLVYWVTTTISSMVNVRVLRINTSKYKTSYKKPFAKYLFSFIYNKLTKVCDLQHCIKYEAQKKVMEIDHILKYKYKPQRKYLRTHTNTCTHVRQREEPPHNACRVEQYGLLHQGLRPAA